ncbi:MAG: nicotinate-nucleotide diphosphorylase (carboxylating) [Polyangiaceae bacterium UTPRO1]|jgi:nicotinate-nucleotide pyrophosphorylase (carboxylating)|nr:carboxylating nicotinate-nucleotide diphosphorylase [Myxococcales bacterium]OQY66958.1 MAG: nicotinate-nucleotide diphosphorylase (carboxylating) [Polyangiaceae bacterium UTPRO1]
MDEEIAARVAALARHPSTRRLVAAALAEDIGRGDVTTAAALAPGLGATATISSEEPCVLAGVFLAPLVYELVDPTLRVAVLAADGAAGGVETPVVRIEGPAAGILAGERVALNLLQHLCGIATLTRRFVAAVAGTKAAIVDTRKTIAGLRLLEKHAVRMGGGVNHRFGLDDGILIKDTHVALGGGTAAVVTRVRERAPAALRVQVECRTLAELDAALAAGADAVLLDNQTPEQAAALIRHVRGRVPVEVSGGITLANVAAYAAAGADRISIGALTHSAPAVPLHLRIVAA